MKVKTLIELLQKEDQEKTINHFEIGGIFPIDVLLDLPDGSLGLAQVESVTPAEEM